MAWLREQPMPDETGTTRRYGAAQHGPAPTEVVNLAGLNILLIEEPQPDPSETTDPGEYFVGRLSVLTEPFPDADRPKEPSREDKVYAELLSYSKLPHGWDGYEGVAASSDAIRDAYNFLGKRPADIRLPYPQIAPDGEVGLYWRTEEVYAEVGFYGDGEFSYYARYTSAGCKPVDFGQDECLVDAGEWPEGLLLVLNKIKQ